MNFATVSRNKIRYTEAMVKRDKARVVFEDTLFYG